MVTEEAHRRRIGLVGLTLASLYCCCYYTHWCSAPLQPPYRVAAVWQTDSEVPAPLRYEWHRQMEKVVVTRHQGDSGQGQF